MWAKKNSAKPVLNSRTILPGGRGRTAAAWQAFDCVLPALNYFMGTRGAGWEDKLGESLPAFARVLLRARVIHHPASQQVTLLSHQITCLNQYKNYKSNILIYPPGAWQGASDKPTGLKRRRRRGSHPNAHAYAHASAVANIANKWVALILWNCAYTCLYHRCILIWTQTGKEASLISCASANCSSVA